jgi:hypothetical protein
MGDNMIMTMIITIIIIIVIKTDFQQIGWEGVDWIDLAQGMGRRLELANAVTNIRVPSANFLTS